MAEIDYSYIAALVSAAKDGSSDAFAELYAATYQKQYRFSYMYLKDEYLAQDALQETYVTALKNLGTLRDPKLFISWLNQINFRVCYNLSVKRAKINGELNEIDENIPDENQAENGPLDRIIKIENREYILQQVLALPYTESQSVFLYYYKNMKLDEIADILEVSRSTVKRHIAAGKKRLARTLAN